MRRRRLLALLLAAWPAPLAALPPALRPSQLNVEVWRGRDGLPEGTVQSLAESRDGYLWIGTERGAARFDGVRFTRFDMGNVPTMQANDVKAVLESVDRSIWIAAAEGLTRYRAGEFAFFGAPQGLGLPYVHSLLEEPGCCIWVGTGGDGLWRLKDGRFTRALGPGDAPDGNVVGIAAEPGVGLWLATRRGVVRVSNGSRPRVFTAADGLPADWATKVLLDRSGRLWVGTRGGLARRDGERFVAQPLGAAGLADVAALAEDGDGGLWVGTHGRGLWRLRGSEAAVLDRWSGLPDDSVSALVEDRRGALWAGTTNGLVRLRAPRVTAWGRPEGLATEDVFALAAGEDGVFIGDAAGGVSRLSGDGSRLEQVVPAGTAKGGVRSMAVGPDGSLWFSGRGLHRLTRGRVTSYEAFRDSVLTTLRVDGAGLLLAASRVGGQALLRFEDGVFRELVPGVFPHLNLHDIRRDARGRVWVSAEGGGLYRFGAGGQRRFLKLDGLPHNTVYGLLLRGEDVWAASRGGLLLVRGDRVHALGPRHGLPAGSINRLLEDARGRLWASGDGGVWRVPLRELEEVVERRRERVSELESFGMADGLRVIQVSWRPSAAALDGAGRAWFATTRGVVAIDSTDEPEPEPPPATVLEEVLLDDRALGAGALDSVPARRRRLVVRYSAPDPSAPETLSFRQQLVGFDVDWVDVGTRRLATFTNLPPGEYTFTAQARRGRGPWGEAARVHFRVPPLWHETMLARLGAVGLLAFAAVGLHRLRVRTLEQRERELARRVEQRTEELRSLNAELDGRVRERTAQLEQAGAVLAAEKQRLAVTLASIGDAVVATDVAGSVVLMNPVAEALTGWSAAEAEGRAFAEVFRLLDCEQREPLPSPLEQALAAGQAVSLPVERALLVSRAGHECLVADSAAPIHDGAGCLVGVVVVFRDVTDKVRAEEQLQRTQRLEALGVLAGGIAHDFNNLLTGIFGYIDLARRRSVDPRAQAPLDRALAVLERARGLAGQLLTFSKGGRPARNVVPLRPLLERCASFALSGASVTCQLVAPDDLWPFEGDEQQIDQVVDNLLINARQAMPRGGFISLRAENTVVRPGGAVTPGRYVKVTVRDHGDGIAPENLSRIFDPFFTTKPGGSGLGLATAHSVVTQHGGHIAVDSRRGQGTTFTILLPAASGAASGGDEPESVPAAGGGLVLVMDDEEYVRSFLQEALAALGFEAVTTSNGSEALAAWERAAGEGRRFDAVILDLTIPGELGGVETVRRLCGLDPTVPAVASSGYSTDPVMTDPARFGFRATLVKPYSVDELARVVRSVMAKDPPAPRPSSS